MIYEVYNFNNESCEIKHGDVIFVVFELDTTRRLSHFQHVAIVSSRKAVSIKRVNDSIPVLEFGGDDDDRPKQTEWPNVKEGYQAQVVGQMVIDGTDLRLRIRNRILETGKQLEVLAERLIQISRNKCGWSPTRYKYIKRNPNDPEIVEEIKFTCSGFVEYCYEKAGVDIVLDDPINGISPLPRAPHPDPAKLGMLIHRFFPGYQIKAFQDDNYPLDLRAIQKPEHFQYFPF